MIFKSTFLLFLGFGLGFVIYASSIDRNGARSVVQADGIVVLTGGKSRINKALKLLAAGKAKRLLISGVHAQTSVGQLARLFPGAKPLFNCCIDLGRAAKDTIGNAYETRSWARQNGFRSLIVVTSAYHMPRAIAEFRTAMPNAELKAYEVASSNVRMDQWWSDSDTLKLLFSEYLKYIPAITKLGFSKAANMLAG